MELWLWALVNALPAPFRAGGSLLVGAIVRAWRWGDRLTRRHKLGWIEVGAADRMLADGITSLGAQTYGTLAWLRNIRIPTAIDSALDGIGRWVDGRIDWVRGQAASLVTSAREWVSARLDDVLGSLRAVRDWINGRVDALESLIDGWRENLLGPLVSPERMAAWVAGAIWAALFRVAYERLDDLVAAMWQARRRLLLLTIAEVERILGRIL